MVNIKDFLPTSLMGHIYKRISKVFANSLKTVLEKIISKSYNAFIRERQILDLVLIANECLDNRIRSRIQGVLCKLDLEKTYNHVNCDFLLYMLSICGFRREKWREWIAQCISTICFSIMINKTPSGFLNSSYGLRQRDPLFPLLFVYIMEALNRMLSTAVDRGVLSSFLVGSKNNDELHVSHLLFADDTLIFSEANPNHLYHLCCLFLYFEVVLGLKTNLAKSELVPVGVVANVGSLASIPGCKEFSLPMKYLCLPLGTQFKGKSIWNCIIKKMKRCLAGRKRLYLSKDGRVTLIKSNLSNFPTYFLPLFPITVRVANRIKKLHRDFLWGKIGDKFKVT